MPRPFGSPFTESVIQDLAKKPTVNPSPSTGPGFSYPQRAWLYNSAIALLEPGGTKVAMAEKLQTEISRGIGPTPWKMREGRTVRNYLEALLQLRARDQATFVQSRFVERPISVLWCGHELALRLGLEFTTGRKPFLRFLWTERRLRSRAKGRILVLVAALAVAEKLGLPSYDRIEAWHLGEDTVSTFYTDDLRAEFPKLDRVLSQAEDRR